MKNIFKILILSLAILTNCQTLYAQTQSPNLKNTQPLPISKLSETYNKPIKIVFSDIDGTLLKFDSTNPKFVMPEEVKETFLLLKQNNIPLILTTGRSYNEAREIADTMGNSDSYIISSQGSQINDKTGKTIYETAISKKESTKIYNEINKYKKHHKLDSSIYIFSNNKMFSPENKKPPYIWEKLTVINSINDLGKDFTCTKLVVLENNPAEIEKFQCHLKKKFPKYKIDISAHCFCDITSPLATKGNAIKVVARLLDKDLGNAAVFGDAQNDISMFDMINQNGGASIAVENAVLDLKQHAQYQTKSVYDFGVLFGVKEIIKHNKKIESKKLTHTTK